MKNLCLSIALMLAAGPAAASTNSSRQPTPPLPSMTRRMLVELRVNGQDAHAVPRATDALRRSLPLGTGRIVRAFEHVPYVIVETAQAAASLAGLDGVRRVHPPTTYAPMADVVDTLSHVRQPEAVARGVTGRGTSVVVLDTGADWTHPDLGTCPTLGADGCRVRYAADMTEADDGVADDERRHGTNVASIVSKMAPEAGIIALDVFPGTGREGSDEAILAGLDWTIGHLDEFKVVAVNISLGSGAQSGFCPDTSLAAGIAAVRAAGVSVVAAAGNDAMKDKIAEPACVPGVLSVGNVWSYDAGTRRSAHCTDLLTGFDVIGCMSNTAVGLALLAPGNLVTAGGVTMSGTSQAAPHVAGALALLRSQGGGGSLDALESRLLTSGRRVYDDRSKLWFPRLDVTAALDAAADESAPVGRVRVEGDKAWTHGGTSLLLLADVSDASNVVEMCASEADTCEEWAPFDPAWLWPVAMGRTELTVNSWFRDRFGHVGGPFPVSVGVDDEPPVDGELSVSAAGRTVTFDWHGASDARSGVAGYSIIEGFGKFPVDCIRGLVVDFGDVANGTISVSDVAPGSNHFYRHCIVDAAGNYSSGRTAFIAIDANAKADDAGSAGEAPGGSGLGCTAASPTAWLVAALTALSKRRVRKG